MEFLILEIPFSYGYAPVQRYIEAERAVESQVIIMYSRYIVLSRQLKQKDLSH